MSRSLIALIAVLVCSYGCERLIALLRPPVHAAERAIVALDEGPAVGPGVFRSARMRLTGGAGALELRWSWRFDAEGEWTELALPAMRVRAANGAPNATSVAVQPIEGESGVQRFDHELLERLDGVVGLVLQPAGGGVLIQPGIAVGAGGETTSVSMGAVGPLMTEAGGFEILPEVSCGALVTDGLPAGVVARHDTTFTVRVEPGSTRALVLRAEVATVDRSSGTDG